MNEESVLTGIIDNTDLLFYKNGYSFTLMPNALKGQDSDMQIKAENGFIYGTTHYGKKLAINTGLNTVHVFNTMRYTMPMYIESQTHCENIELQYFKSIVFVGGALDKLLGMKSLQEQTYERDKIIIDRTVFQRDYAVTTASFTATLKIGLTITDVMDAHELSYKDNVFLRLDFEEDQPISSVETHYKYVNQLISFMTHNRENHIESIYIVPCDDQLQGAKKQCLVHIRDNDIAKPHNDVCLSFDYLGNSVSMLLQLIYNNSEEKPTYSLGFIPRNKSDKVVTDETVRAVASALECEFDADNELTLPVIPELADLCENVREKVRAFQREHKGNDSISNDLFNMIYGDIKRWNGTTREEIIALFNKYRSYMDNYFAFEATIDEKDIGAFVKYRNDISHGNYRVMNSQIRKTTLAMKVLVYLSLLHRSGVPYEQLNGVSIWPIILP